MAMGMTPRIPIRKTSIYSLKDVFGMLFKVTEYKEETGEAEYSNTFYSDNMGNYYEDGQDVQNYENEYFKLEYSQGTGTTYPKFYWGPDDDDTKNNFRFYNGNTIRIIAKEGVKLSQIILYAYSYGYTPTLEYVSGTANVDVVVDDSSTSSSPKCILNFNDEENVDVTFSIVNRSSTSYTQSRVVRLHCELKYATSEVVVDKEYDDEVGNTYPMNKVVKDMFVNNERVLRHTERVDDLFDLLYQAYNLWGIFKISSKSVNDPSEDEVREKFKEWLGKFCYRFDLTYYRYNTLLTLYEDEEGDLLKQISTTTSIDVSQETHQEGEQEADNDSYSENRYNDTPQIENDGSLEDDPYLSQFSKTNGNTKGTSSNKADATGKSVTSQVVSTDKETLINRLDDIQKKIRNLWGDWCDEFTKLFFYD